jgi:glycosyltransferase involved in cell wall biosynthesis
MKVLHVTPVFYPAHGDGGPVIAFYELCRSLAKLGCEVRVLTTDAHGWKKALEVEKEREVEIERNLFVRYCKRVMRRSVSPALLRLLPAHIRWADVVHLSSAYNFPTIPTLAICRILGKPVVWTPHGALQRWEGSRRTTAKSVWEAICRAVTPNTLIIHATSEQEAQASNQRFPKTESVVIPYPIEIPEQVTHVQGNGMLRLLYIGRLDPKKGIENLLDACKILAMHDEVLWSLTIAGAGDPHYTGMLEAKIRELGFPMKKGDQGGAADATQAWSGQVTMVGHVVGDAKERNFQNADMLIVPSHTENFGVVVAEALAREIPVIASTRTPWKTLEDVGCGLWVNNDPENLAKAIERMNCLQLKEMGRRGREWAKHSISGEIVGRNMIRCYERALRTASGEEAI